MRQRCSGWRHKCVACVAQQLGVELGVSLRRPASIGQQPLERFRGNEPPTACPWRDQFRRNEVRWKDQRLRFWLAEDSVKVADSGPGRRNSGSGLRLLPCGVICRVCTKTMRRSYGRRPRARPALPGGGSAAARTCWWTWCGRPRHGLLRPDGQRVRLSGRRCQLRSGVCSPAVPDGAPRSSN